LIHYNKHNYLNYIYNKIDLDKQENWSDWYNIINTITYIISTIKIDLDKQENWSDWYNIINTITYIISTIK
jgi:hypothetical protein